MQRLITLIITTLSVLTLSAQTYDLASFGIPPGGYSGITHIGQGRFAVVSDTDSAGAFHLWQLTADPKVTVTRIPTTLHTTLTHFTDQEDIAYDERDHTLWIVSEAAQRIAEVDTLGRATGRELIIPPTYGPRAIRPNRGFEALAYDASHHALWTTTESPLRTDTTQSVDLLCFSLATLSLQGQPLRYTLDAPRATKPGRAHYHGVSAITVLPDATLLVMEREVYIAQHYLGSRSWVNLYRYSPTLPRKELLHAWTTSFSLRDLSFANYEGLCAVPSPEEPGYTLYLVSDSQHRYGIGRWHLRDWLRVIFGS